MPSSSYPLKERKAPESPESQAHPESGGSTVEKGAVALLPW